MALQGFNSVQKQLTLLNITYASTTTKAIANIGMTGVSAAEFRTFLGGKGFPDDVDKIVNDTFDPPISFNSSGRFHKSPSVALYTALQWPTAEGEQLSRQQLRLAREAYSTVFFSATEFDFDGTLIDVRGAAGMAFLMNPDRAAAYPECQGAADEARARPVDALLTDSARVPGGHCAPVFRKPSIFGRRIVGMYRFEDSGVGSVVATRVA